MNLSIERQNIHNFIDNADERVLNIFKAIIINEETRREMKEMLPQEVIDGINEGIDEARMEKLTDSSEVSRKAWEICMR